MLAVVPRKPDELHERMAVRKVLHHPIRAIRPSVMNQDDFRDPEGMARGGPAGMGPGSDFLEKRAERGLALINGDDDGDGQVHRTRVPLPSSSLSSSFTDRKGEFHAGHANPRSSMCQETYPSLDSIFTGYSWRANRRRAGWRSRSTSPAPIE